MRRALMPLAIAATLAVQSTAAFAALTLVPVVGGLASPVFVTHAGDGSRRLFIVEQPGTIRLLPPGSSTTSAFLDIRGKVRFGGEQGLLGLAFHPRYETSGRFFVYYVRASDQALIVAEYRVSASDPNRGDPNSETVVLAIPHPSFTNHNGGMLAFGPDNYLYIGVGDGGSANDPTNNSQNVNSLLGKILRIDVDAPGAAYASPATNPFVGAVAGRDEIFAYGLRNPWRFTFDRETGDAWLADVGQGSREEVDTPIVNGANYGWRVYEGLSCTNVDPALCRPSDYTPPVFEYAHTGGRCSITGGYAYRGAGRVFPAGTYVYADYCSGEIFTWDGSAQRLVLDTAQSIASFGEDERGELYVVDLDGTISLMTSDRTCTYTLTKAGQAVGPGGGNGILLVRAQAGCTVSAQSNASWIHVNTVPSGIAGAAPELFAVAYTVEPNPQPTARVATLTVGGVTFTVQQNGAGRVGPLPPLRSTR
jgi:glucose/arabinose dehydrogenase